LPSKDFDFSFNFEEKLVDPDIKLFEEHERVRSSAAAVIKLFMNDNSEHVADSPLAATALNHYKHIKQHIDTNYTRLHNINKHSLQKLIEQESELIKLK